MGRLNLNMKTPREIERIELLRGGSVVSSFAGAFGRALRETRLTAILGYLIALEPEPFCKLFGFRGRPLSVSLEARHASDRSDILIKTTGGVGVIEAKITATDPFRQVRKYPADWRVLLTEYAASGKQKRLRGVKYLRWQSLEETLQRLGRSPSNPVRYVSLDLLSYLREHGMIKKPESVEIYARDINDEAQLNLFFDAQMYQCPYDKGRLLAEAFYFSPYFCRKVVFRLARVQVGISYIAKIEHVEVVETWRELLQRVREVRKKPWLDGHLRCLRRTLHGLDWPRKRSFLFLSKPRLAFDPPVVKKDIGINAGFLGKRVFSFDNLFAAQHR